MKKNKLLLPVSVLLLLGLVFTYSNHFYNGFHFDDSHSVVNNIYIRDLKNVPLFFKDGQTLSSLPANQAYRPLMPFFYALDYKLGDGLNSTFQFHLTTFIFYVLQCVLMFFLIRKLFDLAKPGNWNAWLALFATSWYAFHTANAETINYISARSDSISTFFVIAAMWLFVCTGRGRTWLLYLLPVLLGILVKPAALVFPGLLFFYLLFFDMKVNARPTLIARGIRAALLTLPSLILCIGLYIFQGKMTPPSFIPGGSAFEYLITQPFVCLHYFKTFFLPTGLSADTDWIALTTMAHPKFIIGMAFLGMLGITVLLTWKKQEQRPIAYGILWFLIALVPSSSIIPFAEVLNDHRTFFPYVGLAFGATWALWLLVQRAVKTTLAPSHKTALAGAAVLILVANAWGTRVRNEVWKNDETLWKDVTIKSPGNGRGHMNYGLALMQKGDLAGAERKFMDAMKYWPQYSYLHVNLGILKNTLNDVIAAEQYFKNGIAYGPANPEAYYYYADFLYKRGRKAEALPLLEKCIALSPAHTMARYLAMTIYAENYQWEDLERTASGTLAILPGDPTAKNFLDASIARKTRSQAALDLALKNPTPENFLNLSLEFYKEGEYEKCVDAAKESLKLNPRYAEAWNNIGSALNQLGRFEEAEAACLKAIELKPGYELAQNNLNNVRARKATLDQALALVKQHPTPENYLNLSLVYYTCGLYEKCIEASKKALELKPDYADPWNNICSAYNQMKKWDEAIAAGEQALKLNPGYALAKNNLTFARMQKQLQEKKN